MVKPSFIYSKPFLVLAGSAVLMQIMYVNCGRGFKYQVDQQTQEVLEGTVFSQVLVDSPELQDLTTTDDSVTELRRGMAVSSTTAMNTDNSTVDTSIPVQVTTVETTVPVQNGQCNRRSPALLGLLAAIKSMPAEDQDTTEGEIKGCEGGLVRFAAAARDSSGALVRGVQINGYKKARVGVFCPFKNGVQIDILARYFIKNKVRGKGIASTHLCKYGTAPADCNPSHPDYIAGFEYGQYGAKGGVSNHAGGGKGDNAATEGDDIIAKVHFKNQQVAEIQPCNTVALWSPLVIESKFGAGVSTLDPRSTETFFDLTGNGVQHRISCIQGGSFLALPDAQGEVKNINQLFGDNTVGPDGKRSANGFEALGKHDYKSRAQHYGVITADDAVYHQLRLWEDRNCNGRSESDELSSLDSNSIEGIRWIDHTEMQQIDAYGNQTLQRNIAFLSNNNHLRVFDLWFLTAYGQR